MINKTIYKNNLQNSYKKKLKKINKKFKSNKILFNYKKQKNKNKNKQKFNNKKKKDLNNLKKLKKKRKNY